MKKQNKILQISNEQLLTKVGITHSDLERNLSSMMVRGVDYADIYFESTEKEYWNLEDGIIKDGGFNHLSGVGVRALSGEKTGFAFADDISLNSLNEASLTAKRIVKGGETSKVNLSHPRATVSNIYRSTNPIENKKTAQKIELLHFVDREARRLDKRIKKVRANLIGLYKIILVVNSDGILAADIQPLVRLNVSVIARYGKRREVGISGGGGRFSYQYFLADDFAKARYYAKEAVRIALLNLHAVDTPAGEMPVVLAPGWPGVLLHEAVGHGLEGDFNRKGLSAFSGRIGECVASEVCTVVDHGNMSGAHRGSIHIDDEGTPTQRTVLIENGVLKGYMQDKLNARLMGTKSTGNGRRESYSAIPIPRMTNTYMLPGKYKHDEIIASVKKGIYAVNFSGGQVDITSGKFVFSASEAYLIRNGKITKPVKGATLIGSGPEVLTKVSMVGDDLSLDKGVGTCGKDGQSVPVCVGQPTLKVDQLVVGGTFV